jgi:uncharacterized protein YabN with tetrapyrrole methylase and pyrophosphatase domain
MKAKEIEQLTALIQTMRHLRSEQGCAWDRAQTPESLRPYILEEAYELVDALDQGDLAEIQAELGDLLLQVVFQAQIYAERGLFGIGSIAAGIDQKLKRRHPRLFSATGQNAASSDWEQIKRQELSAKGQATDFWTRQPANLPALKLADKYCRYLEKFSAQKNLTGPTGPQQASPDSGEAEDLAAAAFSLACRARQQNIDLDLALRDYIRKRSKNEEQIEQQ